MFSQADFYQLDLTTATSCLGFAMLCDPFDKAPTFAEAARLAPLEVSRIREVSELRSGLRLQTKNHGFFESFS